MKKAEITQGGIYFAEVSGKISKVRVDTILESTDHVGRTMTRYACTNMNTMRQIIVRCASRFRYVTSI